MKINFFLFFIFLNFLFANEHLLLPWPKSAKLNPNSPTIISPKGHTLNEQRCEVTGAAGITQYLAACNAWIQTFNKSDLSPDLKLNKSLEQFFLEISPIPIKNIVHPKLLFDPYSKRWFVFADGVITEASGTELTIIIFAYTEGPLIESNTVWNFGLIRGFTTSNRLPSPGVNKDAIFIGASTIDQSQSPPLTSTTGYFINKNDLFQNPDSFTLTSFFNLDANNGIINPTGVDVFDPISSKGYFFGRSADGQQLVLITIENTNTLNPTRSPNTFIFLEEKISDAIDNPEKGAEYKLFRRNNDIPTQAHIRNGFLYYSQVTGLNKQGVAQGIIDRNGIRWYKIDVTNSENPQLVKTGTLFSSRSENSDYYFIPSIMTNGPETMVLGATVSSLNKFPNAALALRYKNDKNGVLRGPKLMTDTVDPYTFPFIGQYANMSIDPTDNMSI